MTAALADVDAVIHSAGLAHAMSGAPDDDYRALNTEATIELARAAGRAGARRFVFLSSIRAQSGPRVYHVLTEDLTPQPTDAYGRRSLRLNRGWPSSISIGSRCVLSSSMAWGERQYGRAGAAGSSPYPLPVGALRSRRSLLSLDNLVAAIDTVLAAPGQLRRPLIVSDPEALTLPEIVAALRRGLGRHPRLIPVPAAVLRTALYVAGRGEIYERVAGTLVADPAGLANSAGRRPSQHERGSLRWPKAETCRSRWDENRLERIRRQTSSRLLARSDERDVC